MKSTTIQTSLAKASQSIREAIDEAIGSANTAVLHAVRAGQLMIEAKPLIEHGDFQQWIAIEFPQISIDTAQRWMRAAQNVVRCVGIQRTELPMAISEIMGTAAKELPAAAQEAQQLLLDFCAEKTIKDCLAAVIVDGDPAHRITRAHNGRTKGGTRGEDRKNFPEFVGRKLKEVSTHLQSWKRYTPSQVDETLLAFDRAIAKWPRPLLEHLKARINSELKS